MAFLAVAGFAGALPPTVMRPLLRANASRRRKVHVVVFFIFVVSNCGGLLTPLGDPPARTISPPEKAGSSIRVTDENGVTTYHDTTVTFAAVV